MCVPNRPQARYEAFKGEVLPSCREVRLLLLLGFMVTFLTAGRVQAQVTPAPAEGVSDEAAEESEGLKISFHGYLSQAYAATDGNQITGRTNLDELLSFKIGRRVALTVAGAADGSNKREVAVRPVNQQTEKGLLYRKWVEEKRDYVARVSGGRLGYAHMFDMSMGSLTQLFVDLDVENHSREGVVIDVRNNNGGFVNVYAIDVLARRGYLLMTPRDLPTAPARTMLGQRSLERPTILVTNQHSLSDAEDFTEGYRTLKLGKVVGEPTSGWIIYTGSQTLIDGTTIRMPGTRIASLDGKTMERVPRPVDVPVTRPVGESLSGRDSQLDVAVKELIQQLGSSTSDAPRPRQGRFPPRRPHTTRATAHTRLISSHASPNDPTTPATITIRALISAGTGSGRNAAATPIRSGPWSMKAP